MGRPLAMVIRPSRSRNRFFIRRFGRGVQDVVTALDAGSGKTIWEFAYDNRLRIAYAEKVGPGPYAMA